MRKPITRKEWNKQVQFAKNCMRLASTHDPDIINWLKCIYDRVAILERQVELLGAKPYRVARTSNVDHQVGIYAERVRKAKMAVLGEVVEIPKK